MAFSLPPLPYAMDALHPVLSKECLEFHYGKHHKAYVDKLNKLTSGTPDEHKKLEDLIVQYRTGDLFNQAAQIFNHTFFWNGLTPKGSATPTGKVKDMITSQFGSFDTFKTQFQDAAVSLFGSGWVWLSQEPSGKLVIEKTKDADCPLTTGRKPLWTCDVWEHAYYIDYRNERARFVQTLWDKVNWDFVNENLHK